MRHERSQRAANKLNVIGNQKVFYLEGGMLGSIENVK